MADRIDISATVRAVDQASGTLRNIQGTIKSIGETARDASSSLARMATQGAFGGLSQNLQGVRSAVGGVLGAFKGLASPIGALIGAGGIAGAIKVTRDFISEQRTLARVAKTTGASIEGVQAWRYMVGDVETADNALLLLQRNMAKLATAKKPDPRIADVLGKMGINLADVRSGALGMDQVLARLAAGFAKNTNETSKAIIASTLFGKAGLRMIPFLNQGEAGLAAAAEAMKEFGAPTAEQVDEAGRAGAALKEMDAAVKGLKDSIVAELVPGLTRVITETKNWIVTMRPEIVRQVSSAVQTFGRWLGLAYQGIQWVVNALGGWESALETLAIALAASKLTQPIVNLGVQLAKLAGSITFGPLTFGALGLAAAAAVVTRNWDTVGPALEGVFGRAGKIAGEAFSAISNWAKDSAKTILTAFVTGGPWAALGAAMITAGKAIIDNWDTITQWMQDSFPGLVSAAQNAWNQISSYAQTAWQRIREGWDQAGLLGALSATWDQIISGARSIGDQILSTLRSIDWGSVGTTAGTVFGSAMSLAWQAGMNYLEWLRGLDWQSVGRTIAEFLANGIQAALVGLWNLALWAKDLDWIAAATVLAEGFRNLAVTVTQTMLSIGAQFGLGIIEGILNAFGANGERIIAYLKSWIPAPVRGFLGLDRAASPPPPPAAVAQIAETVAQADQASNVIPFPERKPMPPAPLGAAIGAPSVAQPSLLAQARETQVRLDGEIVQRLRVDMSPDLRAQLAEQRAQIANLSVRQQVDVGLSMSPAMGEVA